MRITADTNILVRAVVADDKKQAQAAAKLLKEAELIAVTLPCLCEFVWVLRRVYQFEQENISNALEALLSADNVAVNRAAVDAGLSVLKAGVLLISLGRPAPLRYFAVIPMLSTPPNDVPSG